MKLVSIAAIIESFYYNGRVREGSRKLDRQDFQQMVLAAHGTIARNIYWQMRQEGAEIFYFGDNAKTKDYPVKEKNGQLYIELDAELLNIPFGLGILAVYPAIDSNQQCPQPFVKMQSGADWLYCDVDFSARFYIRKDKSIYLHGDKCLKEGEMVTVEGLYIGNDTEIPDDLVWDIVNAILGPVLKVAGFPIDPNNDHNPNVKELKESISGAGGNP